MPTPLHPVERRVLPNGVTLLHVKTELPISYISLWFPFGSRHDIPGKEGIAHLMEHLLMKMTPELPTSAAMRSFQTANGISYNATTWAERMRFRYMTMAEDAVGALAHFVQVFLTMYVNEERLAAEKTIVADERSRMLQEAPKFVSILTREALFGSRFAHTALGSVESIEAITLADVHAFAKAMVVDAPKTFVICSPFSADEFVAALSNLPAVEPRGVGRSTDEEASSPVPLTAVRGQGTNVRVSLAYALPAIVDPIEDVALEVLMGSYLGGGQSSRLRIRLREEMNLTYNVGGSSVSYTDRHQATVSFSVPKERVGDAVRECEKEIEALRSGVISNDLLASSKKEVRYGLQYDSMNPDDVATWYGQRAMLGRPLQTIDERCARIDALTAQDLQRVAMKYFVPEMRSIVLYGDVTEDSLKA